MFLTILLLTTILSCFVALRVHVLASCPIQLVKEIVSEILYGPISFFIIGNIRSMSRIHWGPSLTFNRGPLIFAYERSEYSRATVSGGVAIRMFEPPLPSNQASQ